MVKISRPSSRDAYQRHRLFERLDEMAHFPVIWISAPAGSGKTTLASSYVAYRGGRCLWYQMDRDDTDPATFFYYITEALKHEIPGIPLTLPLFTPEYLQGIPSFTRRFFESLFKILPENTLMVFDNYHELPDDSPLHGIIQTAFSRVPEGFTIITTSRKGPSPELSRLKANQVLGCLGWDDLRLSEEEASGIVAIRSEHPVAPATVRHLHELSDGWAAGLVLLSELAGNDVHSSVRRETLVSDDIFDYFANEILNGFDQAMRDFLVTTSWLPHMTAQMANEMTGRNDAENILEELNRGNFFTEKSTSDKQSFRYHVLFRKFLQTRLAGMNNPEYVCRIKQRTAIILEGAGCIEDAAELHVATGDWLRLMTLMTGSAQTLINQGRCTVLGHYLAAVPQVFLEGNPWAVYWLGVCRLAVSPQQSREHFRHAFELFQVQGDCAGILLSWSGVVESILYQWDTFKQLDIWIEWLETWLKNDSRFPSSTVEARVFTNMCGALLIRQPWHGCLGIWLERAWNLALQCADSELQLKAGIHAINFYSWKGDRARSQEFLGHVEKLAALPQSSPAAMLAVTWLSAGMLLWFDALPERTLQIVSEGFELSRQSGVRVFDEMLCGVGVFAAIVRRDRAAIAAYLNEYRHILHEQRLHGSCQYHYLVAMAACAERDMSSALPYAKRALEIAEETGYLFPLILCRLEMSYLLCGFGEIESAREHLAGARLMIDRAGSLLLDFMWFLAHAHVCYQSGFQEQGLDSLKNAFRLGRQHGFYMLMYWWMPTVMADLCAKALENGIEEEYVQKLIARQGLKPVDLPDVPENWPWPVRIYSLGRFSIVISGKPLDFSKKSPQMPLRLLKLLIALGGREVAEERLADVLWPDSDGDLAHHAFETTLGRLRKMLGFPEALKLRAGKLSLNDRLCWVDIWAFERLLRQVETHTRRQECDRAANHLAKALALYQGDFLAREEEEDWRMSCADRLQRRFLQTALTACPLLESSGRWRESAAVYQRCLDIDRTNAEWSRHLGACQENLARSR